MNETAAGPTLYDDWLQRRRRLTHLSAVQQPYVVEHRALLDSLLERYRNGPSAARQACLATARFAAPPQPFINRQTVLAYHQLGRAEARGVITETGASKRAASILRRIKSVDPQASAREFALSGVMPAGEAPSAQDPRSNVTQAQLEMWEQIERQIAIRGYRARTNLLFKQIADSLELGPDLPEKAVYYLTQHLDNADAVELLGRCRSPVALAYVFGVWQQRALRKKKGPVRVLEFFSLPGWRRKAAERFRRELVCAESAKVRIQAARALGRLGTLDDVGLLSDLLWLPPWPCEEPRERPALLQAMHRLGRAGMDGTV